MKWLQWERMTIMEKTDEKGIWGITTWDDFEIKVAGTGSLEYFQRAKRCKSI